MKKFDFKSVINLILYIYIPFFIWSVFGWFLISFKKNYVKEVIAFGMLSFIIFIIYLLIKNIRFRKYYLLITHLFLSILVGIKLSFYYNFNSKLSASVLYIIFETNKTEASEFISTYIDYKLIGLYLLFLISFFFTLKSFFYTANKPFISKILNLNILSYFLKGIGICLIFFTVFLIQKRFFYENIILQSIYSYKEYVAFRKGYVSVLSKNINSNIKVTNYDKEPQTYVIIIGESTSKKHLQLYGYNRETNPLLTEIKEELFIFNNVITPHVHTISALQKILTLADYHFYPKGTDNTSIIQLSNQAKYTTYWLSNQRPVGMNESIPSLIGSAAKNTYFLNTDDYTDIGYDSVILPKLEEVLLEKDAKKIVFIHLMGTHTRYKYRYPETFNYFNDVNPLTKFKHAKSKNYVNEYDNAVRYNDYIVRSIINQVKAKNKTSFVLYFSDHGDEVFDSIDFIGHNEWRGTPSMYEVPFILWTSKKYKIKHQQFIGLDRIINRSYVLDDFIHSFSDLTEINFEGFHPEKSIFNRNFKTKTRWIKKGIDYDKEN